VAPVVPAAGLPVETIVSESATAATASALGELTRAMDEKTNKLKIGAGDASISDIVKEMLRPMLREWLDENLPVIVERVVRREIQKLVDRAETDD
jgi:cell pole-organizing protein PopZ